MDEYDYEHMAQAIDRLAFQGDIDYLQLLVFDWREDMKKADKAKAAWGIGAFLGWAAAVILFCVMGWWSDNYGYPVKMLAVWGMIVAASVAATIRRHRYSGICSRYRKLIGDATSRIRQL